MKKILFIIFVIFQAFTIYSCGLVGEDKEEDVVPIARVHDIYLYKKDLQNVIDGVKSAKDSTDIAQRYIDSWIKKPLGFPNL